MAKLEVMLHPMFYPVLDEIGRSSSKFVTLIDLIKKGNMYSFASFSKERRPGDGISKEERICREFMYELNNRLNGENDRDRKNALIEIKREFSSGISYDFKMLRSGLVFYETGNNYTIPSVTKKSDCLHTAEGFYYNHAGTPYHSCHASDVSSVGVKEFMLSATDLSKPPISYITDIYGPGMQSFDYALSESQIVKFCREYAKPGIPYYFLSRVDLRFEYVRVIKNTWQETKGIFFKKTTQYYNYKWCKCADSSDFKPRYIVPAL